MSSPTSRWLMIDRLWLWRNSIGSSTVTMCSGLVRLMMSTSDASDVDLPEPVGPVTSTRPRRISREATDRLGQPERVEHGDLVGNRPHRRGDRPALQGDVHPEPADAGDRVRGVELVLGLEPLPLALRAGSRRSSPGASRCRGPDILDRPDRAVQPDAGRASRREVEVRRADAHRVAQEVVDVQAAVVHRHAAAGLAGACGAPRRIGSEPARAEHRSTDAADGDRGTEAARWPCRHAGSAGRRGRLERAPAAALDCAPGRRAPADTLEPHEAESVRGRRERRWLTERDVQRPLVERVPDGSVVGRDRSDGRAATASGDGRFASRSTVGS